MRKIVVSSSVLMLLLLSINVYASFENECNSISEDAATKSNCEVINQLKILNSNLDETNSKLSNIDSKLESIQSRVEEIESKIENK
jgi:peptidoglycan hydrolase CwlO-like protein